MAARSVRRHDADRVLGQPGLARRGAQLGGERPVRVAIASEPPRRITALPAFTHSAAASTVTLGRDS